MGLAIAGGGGEQDSRPIDENFAAWITERGNLLYIPVALGWAETEYEKALRWIESVFEPFDIHGITMWTSLTDHHAEELERFAGIYIGGGNTYLLLKELRRTRLDTGIVRFVAGGGSVYGGSAGAVVMGRDISTVGRMDENEVGIRDTNALNLVQSHSVWVHFVPSHRTLVEDHCHTHDTACIALSERAGAVLEDGTLRSVGYDTALLFDGGDWQELPRSARGS